MNRQEFAGQYKEQQGEVWVVYRRRLRHIDELRHFVFDLQRGMACSHPQQQLHGVINATVVQCIAQIRHSGDVGDLLPGNDGGLRHVCNPSLNQWYHAEWLVAFGHVTKLQIDGLGNDTVGCGNHRQYISVFYFFADCQREGQQMLCVEQTHIVGQGGVLPQNCRDGGMVGRLAMTNGAINGGASGCKVQRL